MSDGREQQRKKKRWWQAVLVVGLLFELVMIGLLTEAVFSEDGEVPWWEILTLVGIAVWIYIAYLKQSSIDISRTVVEEKIKTQMLAEYLRDGVMVLDENHTVLLCNSRAASVLGVQDMDLLGHDLSCMVDDTVKNFLVELRSGNVTGRLQISGCEVTFGVFALPERQSDGARNRLLYVSAPEAAVTTAKGVPAAVGMEPDPADALGAMMTAVRQPEESLKARALMQGEALQAMWRLAKMPSSATGEPGVAWSAGQAIERAVQRLKAQADVLKIALDMRLNDTPIHFTGATGLLDDAIFCVVAQAFAAAPQGGTVRLQTAPMGSHVGLAVLDGGAAPEASGQMSCFDVQSDFLKQRLPSGLTGLACGYGVCRAALERCGGTLTAEKTDSGEFRVLMMIPSGA